MEINEVVRALECGNRVFVIRGAAGTGKTTLVKLLVPMLRRRGFNPSLLAPTGRAALVLSKRTGFAASTIHSGIFNIVDEPIKDESGSALKWIFPLKKDKDIENVAFVVDESSMVGLAKHDNDRELFQFGSGSLLGDLIEYSGVKVLGTTNLLFFVGDAFQLPPVGERSDEMPPALDVEKLRKLTGFNPYILELTKVHRQDNGSGILAEAVKIRNALSTQDFNVFRISPHEDVTLEDSREVVATWESLDQLDDKIIIAQTNVRVREFNDEARQRLNQTDKFPMCGERLLSIRNTRGLLENGTLFQVYNGDFLRVIDVPDVPEFELEGYYRPKDSNEIYRFKYVFKKMSFSWVYEPERGVVSNAWVNVTPIIFKEWDLYDTYATIGLYNGAKQYHGEELRKKHPDYRKDSSRKTYWDVMLRQELKNSVWLHAPIVKFGYAVTGHKSQGGEWDHVWADYSFGSNLHSIYFFRWAYTVTTRAKKHLHVLRAPQIDTVTDVFNKGLKQEPSITVVSDPNNKESDNSPISALIEENGFKIDSLADQFRNFKYRIFVTRKNDGISGWIDIMFRKNGIISSVNAGIGCPVNWIDELKGRSVKDVFGTGEQDVEPTMTQEVNKTAEILIASERKRAVVQRIAEAINRASFRLMAVEEVTMYHIRLQVITLHGDGHINLYFNGREQLTSRDTSLPDEDMRLLVQMLNCVSESSEGS